MSKMVECLLSKCKTLSSNPILKKKRRKKKSKLWREGRMNGRKDGWIMAITAGSHQPRKLLTGETDC
jgi:hypothetical protein